MVKIGKKFMTYSDELKKKAIEMRLKGITSRKVAEILGIHDITRLKIWMRKYKAEGEFGLVDRRGRRVQYVDREKYIRKLEVENIDLKKVLEIWKKGGRD